MAEPGRPGGLSGGQRLAIGVSVLLGLGLAGYGVAGSYKTVSVLAARRGVPLAPLVPVGIDGGLIGVIALDLVLSWTGQPIGWLRQLVRALTVGTVAANAAAGWPDLVAAGLHAAAPLMLLAMVEAGRTVLLRQITGLDGQVHDPIPAARWVLAPWSTWLMWRRNVLWRTGGYSAALVIEERRRMEIALLRIRHGRKWRRHLPADSWWLLGSGIPMSETAVNVTGLVNGRSIGPPGSDMIGGRLGPDRSAGVRTVPRGRSSDSGAGSHRPVEKPPSAARSENARGRRSATLGSDRGGSLGRAAGLLEDRPDMTGADIGRELGVSPRHGLRLKKQVAESGVSVVGG